MIQGVLSHNRNLINAIARHPTFSLPAKLAQARAERAAADAEMMALEDRVSILFTNGYCGLWANSMVDELERLEKARAAADRFHRIVRTLEKMEGGADMEFSTTGEQT